MPTGLEDEPAQQFQSTSYVELELCVNETVVLTGPDGRLLALVRHLPRSGTARALGIIAPEAVPVDAAELHERRVRERKRKAAALAAVTRD